MELYDEYFVVKSKISLLQQENKLLHQDIYVGRK